MQLTCKIILSFVLLLLGSVCGEAVLQAQCPMVCRQDFTISLGGNGEAELNPIFALVSSTDGCTEGFTIEIIDINSGYVYGSVADATMINADLIFKVTDNATGNNCDGGLTVEDNTPPQVFVDSLFLSCNAEIDPEEMGFPYVIDNVSNLDNITFDWFDQLIDYDCFYQVGGVEYTAEIVRNWYVSDQYGNIRNEQQSIMLKRNTLDDVIWPANRDDFVMPSLACNEDDPMDLVITGQPRINGKVIEGSSDCDLLTSFSDQTTVICGGETKIFRTWAVFDYCTDESETFIQLIRVKDIEAPIITCPENINIGTNNNLCTGTVVLTDATATDNCSDYTISHTWNYGTDEMSYENIPQGTHNVTYTAEDECGNKSHCEIEVTVTDDEVPTPVCKEHTFVSLSDSGENILSAHTFNESSSDNCLIDRFEVSKNGVDFYPAATFNCDDIPVSPMSLTLRVFDVSGHHNDCEVMITIDDYLLPVLVCPLDLTLDCFDDINDLTISDLANATDNCDIANISHTDDLSNLNSCGFGTVFRLWNTEDVNGNSAVCVQQISIGDATPTGVNFPPDFITYDCSLELNPVTTGMPEITNEDCEQILVFHEDDTITVSDACLHIVRFWEVYDECIFDPNNAGNGGYWSVNQTLKIYDNDAPEVQNPADITVFISGDNCDAYVEFPDATAIDCSEDVKVSNNSLFSDNNEANASGTYPYGFHYITFTARDECDNITNKITLLTVLDEEIPVIECNGGFTVNLDENGMAAPDPYLFDAGSYDNCSEALTYHIEPTVFNCDDRGIAEVLFQVRDESGNEASCFTTLNVQDNNNVCDSGNLGGKISNEEGETIGGKYVGLSGGIQMAVQTETDGTYEFPNLPSGEYYELKPTYDLNHVNGVTTNDILQIRKHVLGVNTFTSPYTLIAADVNNSGSVTTVDLVWIRRLILGNIESFPDNKSWRFVDATYDFIDDLDPFDENFPERIIITSLNQNYLDNDFVAIKIGDVNGTANFANGSSDERTEEERSTLPIYIENTRLEADNEYKIPFRVKDFKDISGMQLSFGFDANVLKFNDMQVEDLPEMTIHNFGLTQIENGLINFSWDTHFAFELEEDAILFTLIFTANKDANLADVLHLNKDRINAEAYRANPQERAVAELLNLELIFDNEAAQNAELFQNYPNPTSGKTTVSFYLPQATETILKVLDAYGNILWREENNFGRGTHTIELDLSKENWQPGVYFYRLESTGFRDMTRKFVLIRN